MRAKAVSNAHPLHVCKFKRHKETFCYTPTTSTESTWSTKSLFPKYRLIWEKRREAEGRREVKFGSYFWQLDELHTNCTPPCAHEVPCNDFIIEATYMSMATCLLEYPENERGEKEKTVKTVISHFDNIFFLIYVTAILFVYLHQWSGCGLWCDAPTTSHRF